MARTKSSSAMGKIKTIGVTVSEERLQNLKRYYHLVSVLFELPEDLSFNDFVLHLVVTRIMTLDNMMDREIRAVQPIEEGKTAFLSLRIDVNMYNNLLKLGAIVKQRKGLNFTIEDVLRKKFAFFVSSTIGQFSEFYTMLDSMLYFHLFSIIEAIFGEFLTSDDRSNIIKKLTFPEFLIKGKKYIIDYMSQNPEYKAVLNYSKGTYENESITNLTQLLNEFNAKLKEKGELKEYTKQRMASLLYIIKDKRDGIIALIDRIKGSSLFYGRVETDHLLMSLARMAELAMEFRRREIEGKEPDTKEEYKKIYEKVSFLLESSDYPKGNPNPDMTLYQNRAERIYSEMLDYLFSL